MFEIGVYQGGSLGMWRNYFGQQARIIGIDLDPACADRASEGVHIEIGDQSDPAFLQRVVDKYGAPDIVLDDGGHTAHQQITSFEILYPHLRLPGVYLVEDTHTAFWGGSYDDRSDGRSFLDFSYDRARFLHEWTKNRSHFERLGIPLQARPDAPVKVSDFCRRTGSVAFYDSIVVFEWAERNEPWHEMR